MDINRIETILLKNCELILSAQSFTDRMEKIYEIIDNEFPKKSIASAIYGAITDMGDFLERAEIDQLLQIIRHSANIGEEVSAMDSKFDAVLMLIYDFIKKEE